MLLKGNNTEANATEGSTGSKDTPQSDKLADKVHIATFTVKTLVQ